MSISFDAVIDDMITEAIGYKPLFIRNLEYALY